MVIKVIKPGFFSTIQDLGRFRHQDLGVPVSGAMDQYSAKFANALLNNKENDAVLEMTMTGPILEFNCHTSICISGANMFPKLNDSPIKLNAIYAIKPNDVLTFSALNYGFRTYLAVIGGFQTEVVLGSRSMYKNLTSNLKLEVNDELAINISELSINEKNAALKYNSDLFSSINIDVFKGPEFELLSSQQQKLLFEHTFTISNLYDRMAYQLEELFKNDIKPIITSLVLPGTVQLTPSGNLIILMRDCQTTGGYPRILQLKESSIDCLSQKFRGNSIRFQLVAP